MSTSTALETVKAAKKPHRCSWCDTLITVGESYKRYRYFDGDDAATVKLHPECNEALEETVAEEGYDYEFHPGENPRGCNCGFTHGCDRCEASASGTQSGQQGTQGDGDA